MPSSGFPRTVDSDPRQDGFLGPSDEFLGDFYDVNPTVGVSESPVQSFVPLPPYDLGYPWPQPSQPSFIPNSIVPPSSPNAPPHFDAHDWPSQSDVQSAQYSTPIFNLQDSGLVSTVMPTTQQLEPFATLDAGRSSMSQGHSSRFMDSSSSLHDALYSPPNQFSPSGNAVPSHHNSSPMSTNQTKLLNSEIRTSYEQILPALAGLALGSPSIPPNLPLQPMVPRFPIERTQYRNSRRISSITSYPHHPIRTSSLPVQAIPLEEMAPHICQWVKEDGTICGAKITWTSVPKHLTLHGVEHMAHNIRVPCRWFGCRIKGNQDMMNRESIVRHVREKHLGCRRSL